MVEVEVVEVVEVEVEVEAAGLDLVFVAVDWELELEADLELFDLLAVEATLLLVAGSLPVDTAADVDGGATAAALRFVSSFDLVAFFLAPDLVASFAAAAASLVELDLAFDLVAVVEVVEAATELSVD